MNSVNPDKLTHAGLGGMIQIYPYGYVCIFSAQVKPHNWWLLAQNMPAEQRMFSGHCKRADDRYSVTKTHQSHIL